MSSRQPTGNQRIDALLRAVVDRIEDALAGKIRSYYLYGSYASGGAVPASDVDLCLISRGELRQDEVARAGRIARACGDAEQLAVDVLVLDDRAVLETGHYRIGVASVWLHGEDIRRAMPPMTLTRYIAQYTQAPYAYAARVLRRQEPIVYPLGYPDPGGEFYGYDLPHLPHGDDDIRNTTALVALVCWAATLLVAWSDGSMVPSRAEAPLFYRRCVGDGWADFVVEVHQLCKERWGYLIPADPAERAHLSTLCARALVFENHYFGQYRSHLLALLRGHELEGQLLAAQRLGKVIYRDAEMVDALKALRAGPHAELQQAAADALAQIQSHDPADPSAPGGGPSLPDPAAGLGGSPAYIRGRSNGTG